MAIYRDEAVVLRTHKLGEADRICTLLTRNNGKVSAVAKGVRKVGSKFGARLEPFMVADIQFYEGRTLDTISQAETLGSYGAQIVADYASYTAATAMVEAAARLTESDPAPRQYLLLVGALRSLSRGEHSPTLTLDSYLLRALSIAGWAPSFYDCARCGKPGPHERVMVQVGGAVCSDCAPQGAAILDTATRELLIALLAGAWDLTEDAPENIQARASGIVAAYTQFHLDRSLRALDHIDGSRTHNAPTTRVSPGPAPTTPKATA
ncbi:DNA repair protein RecO [Mycetocola tolaasinivorans]|uniref:DNA repair protein RecO n=1 Tax=Mycetocola tolaasinivorans TaxID=76635 RepID=A0A3L7A972_9MICO|nr:DNA repair protein RecO [Mycetocola tolaasinivorans]RLP76889.1 DNA repair protein RecO [Mycetocola tolaasinivorans]